MKQVFDALREAGSEVDLHIYDDSGHAFMRPSDSYVEGSAKDAWQQIDTFFADHLKSAK